MAKRSKQPSLSKGKKNQFARLGLRIVAAAHGYFAAHGLDPKYIEAADLVVEGLTKLVEAPTTKRKRPMDPVLREAVYSAQDAFNCSWFEALKYAKEKLPDLRASKAARDAEKARKMAIFEAWTHPAGTPVFMRLGDGTERETKTRSKAWLPGGSEGDGRALVQVEGIVGGYSLDRIRLRTEGAAA